MDTIITILTHLAAAAAGWLAHVLYKHNPDHIAQAKAEGEKLVKKVKG